jgi:hypothetical protein
MDYKPSSSFERMIWQSGNLAIWQSGNLAIWQSGNLAAIWQQSGNLGMSILHNSNININGNGDGNGNGNGNVP